MARYCGGDDPEPLFEAIEHWKSRCLVEKLSLFKDKLIWNKVTVQQLADRLVEAPILGGEESFYEKLTVQLEPLLPECSILAAEMIWVLSLFSHNVGPQEKKDSICFVHGLSGEKLDEQTYYLSDKFLLGIASTGRAYSQFRWRELRYFASLLAALFNESAEVQLFLLKDHVKFSLWLENIPENKSRQFRHMLLYALFPDEHERIFSRTHRHRLLSQLGLNEIRFSQTPPRLIDAELLSIRHYYERVYRRDDLDFYVEPLSKLWNQKLKVGSSTKESKNLGRLTTSIDSSFGLIEMNGNVDIGEAGSAWTAFEIEFIVSDYFDMLISELKGEEFTKAQHSKRLMQTLTTRTKGSIEMKHQNVSAILIELDHPYIKGYQPLSKYQSALKDVVIARLVRKGVLVGRFADELANEDVVPSEIIDLKTCWQPPPILSRPSAIKKSRTYESRGKYKSSSREARNRLLGRRGEEFVLALEKQRLREAGYYDQAEEVQWTSEDVGDGKGFDIKSFDERKQSELFIEVKTTCLGKYAQFFISPNELEFSKDYDDQYALYRVFDFGLKPNIFKLTGDLTLQLNLEPSGYKASF